MDVPPPAPVRAAAPGWVGLRSLGRPRPRGRRWRAVGLVAAAAVALGLWGLVLPRPIGGFDSYVIVYGQSMLPRFRAGDLVVVRPETTYRIGQVVAYHNRQLHEVVLHRIVAIRGSRYVFRGDNNHFDDFYHPTRRDLIGALWVHLQGWGAVVQNLRTPLLIAVALALLATFGWLDGTPNRRQQRRRHRHA